MQTNLRCWGHSESGFCTREAKALCTRRSCEENLEPCLCFSSRIFSYKVKYLAGIAGNGCADKVSKYQTSLKGDT
eukprot:scaffold306355_cov17-Tisochrysis_lutea.AAC.1